MNKEPKFKYQKQIDELLSKGCQLPELFAPNNMPACRFAFSKEGHQNHIPQYMSNPKRMLQDINKGKANTSLLALSCFTNTDKAEASIPISAKHLRMFPPQSAIPFQKENSQMRTD